jgi:hypothetical protein
MSSHRWSKFWWADYERDPALRGCSLASQGLWMRLLCFMHEGTPYGHLTVNGKVPSAKRIAAMVGKTEREIVACLIELEDAAVFNRTDQGVIQCRRMVRDKAASDAGRAFGAEGGNPILKQGEQDGVNGVPDGGDGGGGLTPPVNAQETHAETPKVPEEKGSLRSPTRAETADEQGKPSRRFSKAEIDAYFEVFWRLYPRRVKKLDARKAYERAVAKLPPEALMDALRRYVWPREAQFIPYPASWLNGERWADEATPQQAAPTRPVSNGEATMAYLRGLAASGEQDFPGMTINGETIQ